MHSAIPTVYLLAGQPGSGKTTYAKALEAGGVVRLAVAEETQARHGAPGVDYPASEHDDRQQVVLAELSQLLVAHVLAGRDVVLDHGLGHRTERDFYKQLVEDNGGQWFLINFTLDHSELIRQLERRIG